MIFGISPASITYLTGAEVRRFMPASRDAVGLVREALVAIAEGRATLGHGVVRPRPDFGLSSIVGVVAVPGGELVGQKWVTESAAHGVVALLMMNDPVTGAVHTLMDARALTGLRTAAVSGACVEALGLPGVAAIVGTGLQCRMHILVLEALGWREIRVAYRRRESADAIAAWAAAEAPHVALTLTPSIEACVRGASIVVTAVTRGATGAAVAHEWLRHDALVLPVDFTHCIGAETAHAAALIATDHPDTYREVRDHGGLPGYPDPHMATGVAIARPRPAGMIVIQNIGNGACDLVIAEHVRRAAQAAGAGVTFER
jgi:ornithine cyclodeaminase/alanine dehydrogenase-like protein (mu-crystallin family)